MCAKRALARLRVAADWRAPIERNQYEARWMRVANEAHAGCAPRVLGQHPGLGVLVMDYLPPTEYALWKQQLRDGRADAATAREVGRVLGRIHSHSARRPELAAEFDTDRIFFDIRLEPYLLATAQRHPDLAPRLEQLVDVTRSRRVALVHGDVSPKNILVGASGAGVPRRRVRVVGRSGIRHRLLPEPPAAQVPVDAGRDAGVPRLVRRPGRRRTCRRWTGKPPDRIEQRAAALLPGLFLARVDGKSPVEYVTEERQREQVRRVAGALLRQPVASLRSVRAAWAEELER